METTLKVTAHMKILKNRSLWIFDNRGDDLILDSIVMLGLFLTSPSLSDIVVITWFLETLFVPHHFEIISTKLQQLPTMLQHYVKQITKCCRIMLGSFDARSSSDFEPIRLPSIFEQWSRMDSDCTKEQVRANLLHRGMSCHPLLLQFVSRSSCLNVFVGFLLFSLQTDRQHCSRILLKSCKQVVGGHLGAPREAPGAQNASRSENKTLIWTCYPLPPSRDIFWALSGRILEKSHMFFFIFWDRHLDGISWISI